MNLEDSLALYTMYNRFRMLFAFRPMTAELWKSNDSQWKVRELKAIVDGLSEILELREEKKKLNELINYIA